MSGFWVMTLVLAELLPPARPGLVPPSLVVLDEQNRHQSLMTAGAATLLLPIFTRCAGTCPVTAASLKQALPGASGDFRVVLLSFDPRDTAAELLGFRKRLDLPSGWLLVRSVDARATRELFDVLEFPVMNSGGGLQSPRPDVRLLAERPVGRDPVGPALEGGAELGPRPGPRRRRWDSIAEAGSLAAPPRGVDRGCVRWARSLVRRRPASRAENQGRFDERAVSANTRRLGTIAALSR